MRKKARKKNHCLIWSEKEKEAWKLPEKITVSQWADKHRVLGAMTGPEPGPWRTSRTPYLAGIMDAFCDPMVEEITIMAGTQLGKTECMYNMLGYAIDQDPGPALLVMPREADAKKISYNRVKPMLELSDVLRKHLPDLDDDISKLEHRLDNMIITFAGSNSPAALAQRAVRYVFFDETDKYPPFSGREADPIKLAIERTKTYWNRKIVKVSSPTTRQGYIFREYERSSRRRFYVPCPHCGRYQVLVWGQIKIPEEERDPEKIISNRLAEYICRYCQMKIEDKQKPKIMTRGVWAPEDAEISAKGKIKSKVAAARHVGFWLSSLYSPWLTWSDIAAEFFRSQGRPAALMNFANSWLAEVFEERTEETKPEILAAKAGRYVEGVVPAGCLVLTAGVDVQKNYFILGIRGWGYGEESWSIRACRVESWDEVESILFMTQYPQEKGDKTFPVLMTCIDSGYRTDEVYDVCRRWKDRARPVKGHDHLAGVPYKINHLDRHPRTGKIIPNGLILWHIDTSHYKDKINRMVHAEPGDPAQWHLFKNPSDAYLKQFCAEHKIIIRNRKTGVAREEWVKVTQGRPNHYLDVEVYAAAAADTIQVYAMRKDHEMAVHHPRPDRDSDRREGSWIRRSGGKWLR